MGGRPFFAFGERGKVYPPPLFLKKTAISAPYLRIDFGHCDPEFNFGKVIGIYILIKVKKVQFLNMLLTRGNAVATDHLKYMVKEG